jgi:2-phosphoglycerate kinase
MTSGNPSRSGKVARTLVEDDHGQRPFMRGIMVHSLLSRGASFEDAYRSASDVRERIRGRGVVRREELAKMVEDLVGGDLEDRPRTLPPTMGVDDGTSETPFSKGVLAQSLLAAAVAPDEAFTVAREIEADLVQAGRRVIGRDELRRLVGETLARTLGKRSAMRYRVWRNFLDHDKPMILLLGGAAGVGKTALAQEVAHRLGIPRVASTDAIRQVMRIMLSKELVPSLHASSYDAHLSTPGLEDVDDPVIEAFRSQASTVSVGVRAMIDRAVEENTSTIVEGVSIIPGLLDLSAWAGDAHVIFLTVSTLDADAFASRFRSRGRSSSRGVHRYVENLDAILRIQEHVLELADQHELAIVDNQNFDNSVRSVLRHVIESLRKGEEGDGGNRS